MASEHGMAHLQADT